MISRTRALGPTGLTRAQALRSHELTRIEALYCTVGTSGSASTIARRYQSFMESTLLASEFRKVGCSERLASVDFWPLTIF